MASMKKNNPIIESLVNYLSNVSQEQFEKDWAILDEYNNIGPEVDDFILQAYDIHYQYIDDWLHQSNIDLSKLKKNPEYILDSFFYHYL
jgi:hypothetical protein